MGDRLAAGRNELLFLSKGGATRTGATASTLSTWVLGGTMMRASIRIERDHFDRVMSRLFVITSEYRETSDPAMQRKMWKMALGEACRFLDEIQPDWRPSNILFELVNDLDDLCNGLTPPRLKHEKKRGRPRNTTADKTHFANQAALIEYLMRAGLSERDAAKQVAHQAKKIGAPLPKSTSKSRRSDHNRLLDWRARLRSASPDDENFKFAKATYQRHLDLHKKLKEKFTDKEIADCFLKLFWPELLGKKLD